MSYELCIQISFVNHRCLLVGIERNDIVVHYAPVRFGVQGVPLRFPVGYVFLSHG
jgi:hypothetical protein